MTGRSFRAKPSESHIVWTRETRNGATTRRFDSDRFRQWAEHYGFDFTTTTRVDHERADRPLAQYRCVFAWGRLSDETISMGDEEWSLGAQKTPRTFVEIDETGQARVKGWSVETVIDIAEMRHRGPTLLIEMADGETKRLDARTLLSPPDERRSGDA